MDEKFKVEANDLKENGYNIPDDNTVPLIEGTLPTDNISDDNTVPSPTDDCPESEFHEDAIGSTSSSSDDSFGITPSWGTYDYIDKLLQMEELIYTSSPTNNSFQRQYEMETSFNAAPSMNITNLNDDCLERIFKLLQLQDQLRFAQCHYQVEEVFMKTIIEKMPRHLTIELYEEIKDYSNEDIEEFWCCYGAYFESMDEKALLWNQLDYNAPMYKAMHKYCKNLKRLEESIPVSNASLLSLNDDCLVRIFKLLNLQEQICLSSCHKHLSWPFKKCIIREIIPNFRFPSYEEIQSFTDPEMLEFWESYAEYLRSIDLETESATSFVSSSFIANTMRKICIWSKGDSPPSTATIMSLNENHIEKLFKFLHLQQQVCFAYCRSKFEKLRIGSNWSTYFTNIFYEVIRSFSEDHIYLFWRCYGLRRLWRIDAKALLWNQLDYSAAIYNAMHKYCPNIKLLGRKRNVTILVLNNDCFTHLFDLLSVQDQVRIALSHPLLERAVTEYMYQEYSAEFNAEMYENIRKFSDDEMQKFWQCYGPHVQSFDMKTVVYKNFDFSMTTYGAIRRYCTNLQRLEFTCRPLAEYSRFISDINMQTITEIDISRCNIVDYMLKPLRLLPNLVALGLSYNCSLLGRPIVALRQLKRLSLFNCRSVKMETLLDICKAIKLRYLDIRNVYFYNINAIIEHCDELEEFKFSVMVEESLYENVGLLPKLKSLTVVRVEPIRVSFFYILADYHGHDLEELKITRPLGLHESRIGMNVLGVRRLRKLRTFWMYNFHLNQGSYFGFYEIVEMNLSYSRKLEQYEYLNIVKSFTKLKRLCTYGCLGLRHSLIRDVIAVLERRAERSKTPVTPLFWLLRDERSKYQKEMLMMLLKDEESRDGKRRAKQKDVENNPVYLKARHLLRLMYVMQVVPDNEGSLYEVPLFPAESYKYDK